MSLSSIGLGFILTARDLASAAFRAASAAVSELERAAGSAGASVEEVSSLLKDTGAKMMGVGVAGLAGLGVAAHSAMEFGASVAEVATVADAAQFSMEGIRDIGKDLAATYGGDINQHVKSLYQAISSGASTSADASDLLHASNKLATAGLTDSFLAVDALTNVVNGYSMKMGDATQVSDAMFVTVKKGKTTVAELGSVIGRVAPTAASLGVSLDEMFAVVAASSTKLGNATESVTGFKAMLSGIMSPTKEASDEAKRLGVAFDGTALRTKGLSRFIGDITSSANFNAETFGKLFGSLEAYNVVQALTANGSATFNDALDAMGKKAGATEAAFSIMNSTTKDAAESLQAKLQVALVNIGEKVEPILANMLDAVSGLVDAFNELPDSVQTGIVAVFAIGSVLLIVGGAALVLLGTIAGIGAAVPALSGAVAVIAAAAPAAGIAAVALAGLVSAVAAVGVAVEKNVGGLSDRLSDEAAKIKLIQDGLAEVAAQDGLSSKTVAALGKSDDAEKTLEMLAAFDGMINSLSGTWDMFVEGFNKGVEAMGPLFKGIGQAFSAMNNTLTESMTILSGSFSQTDSNAAGLQFTVASIGAAIGSIGSVIAYVVTGLGLVISMVLPIIAGVLKGAIGLFGGFVDIFIDVIDMVYALVNGDFAGAFNALKKIVLDAVMAVVRAVAGMVEGIAGAIDSVRNAVDPGSSNLRGIVSGSVEDIKKDLAGGLGVSADSSAQRGLAAWKPREGKGATSALEQRMPEMPQMPAPTAATAPAVAGATDMAALTAALQQGQKGGPPIDVNLKSVLVVDGSQMAETVERYMVQAGQRGLAPTPMP